MPLAFPYSVRASFKYLLDAGESHIPDILCHNLLTDDKGDLVDGGDGKAHHEATGDPRPKVRGKGRHQTKHLLDGQTHQEGHTPPVPYPPREKDKVSKSTKYFLKLTRREL